MKTKTKKDLIENYDPETDTMYVSFGSGEPSFCEELDDILVLERGMFSGLPTGFRIINFKKHNVSGVVISLKKKVDSAIKKEQTEVVRNLKQRAHLLQQGLRNTLQPA